MTANKYQVSMKSMPMTKSTGGFQTTSFLKNALANTSFMMGRQAQPPMRTSVVMAASKSSSEPSVSGD